MISLLLSIFSRLIFGALHTVNTGSFPPKLSKEEEKELLEKMKNGDTKAKDKLIEHNLRLVAHISKKYYSKTNDPGDLISVGTIGLVKGIDSFDTDKGTKLATYIARCIENEILMYFRNQKKTSYEVFMNEPIDFDSEGNPLTLMDIISVNDTIADDIDLKMKAKQLYLFISQIENPREKYVILHRYGIFGNEIKTQRQIAKELKISRSYVSRIEKKVICDLRKKFDV